jgi:hypothetical protein
MRESGVDQDGPPSPAEPDSERGGAVSGESEKDARNQALFREVNERIGEFATGFEVDGHDSYICECGNPQCTEPMELTRAEYEAVREQGNRFAVAPDHENPAAETVVEEHGRYSIVEALAGAASRIARETDPRSQTNKHTRGV